MLARFSQARFPIVLALLAAAVLLNVFALSIYNNGGYHEDVFYRWIVSLILGAGAFLLLTDKKSSWRLGLTRFDIYLIFGLVLMFIPVYFSTLYYIPFQLNTDEPTIMHFSKEAVYGSSFDPFGITNYFRYPALIFVIFGGIADWLGGISLYTFRVVHASSAILIIVFSYLLLRLAALAADRKHIVAAYLLPFAGAAIVGFNHALMAVSRMAMRDNSALLIEVIAFTLLGFGILRKNWFLLFMGALAVGLSFYVYLPARIIIVLWALFLGGLGTFFDTKYHWLDICAAGAITILGVFLVVSPLLLATLAAEETEFTDISNKFLFSKQAQQEQQAWVGAASIADGLRINTMQGLTMFNNNLHDHNYVYPNYGHGFVDPLTGILIWIGLASVLMRWARKSEQMEFHLFFVGCFVVLWLVLSFFFNKNPHYNRLLSTLPFVAFLASEALYMLGNLAASIIKKFIKLSLPLAALCVVAGTLGIVVWNLSIFSDFVTKGLRDGDALGATARYTEEKREMPGYSFYLAADAQNPYYTWGIEGQWRGWLGTFVGKDQHSTVVHPDMLSYEELQIPFTLFMNKSVWDQQEYALRARYPGGTFISMVPNGTRVAYEVLGGMRLLEQ